MRYLGIDYGKVRVGLAVSLEGDGMVYPLKVIINSENLVDEILKICQEKNIETVVVGESLNFKMEENEIMADIKIFTRKLREKGLGVVMHPEFFSSAEAERLQGKNSMLDASAAAIILQSYLDMNKNDTNIRIHTNNTN